MTEPKPELHQTGRVPASETDADVQAFVHICSLAAKPVYLPYQEFGYVPVPKQFLQVAVSDPMAQTIIRSKAQVVRKPN